MALAGKLLGAGAPKWQRLEAICAEYLGAHPDGAPDDGGVGPERAQLDDWMEETKDGGANRRAARVARAETVRAAGPPAGDARRPDLVREGAPRRGLLLQAAFRAARTASGRPLSRSECIEAIARHFVDTWKPLVVTRNTVQKRVPARDRGFCQVPGCSRAAVHAHHVLFRSLGGGDEPQNLVSLCAAHHLHGVHMGWIRVRGRAPDELRWQLGAGAGVVPIAQA